MNFLQLFGVVLALTSFPILDPNELRISEILCHSSFSSKGDKIESDSEAAEAEAEATECRPPLCSRPQSNYVRKKRKSQWR